METVQSHGVDGGARQLHAGQRPEQVHLKLHETLEAVVAELGDELVREPVRPVGVEGRIFGDLVEGVVLDTGADTLLHVDA